jgi:hypothetical protein
MGVLAKDKVRKKQGGGKFTVDTLYTIETAYLNEAKLSELHFQIGQFRSKPSMKIQSMDRKFLIEDEEDLLLYAKL